MMFYYKIIVNNGFYGLKCKYIYIYVIYITHVSSYPSQYNVVAGVIISRYTSLRNSFYIYVFIINFLELKYTAISLMYLHLKLIIKYKINSRKIKFQIKLKFCTNVLVLGYFAKYLHSYFSTLKNIYSYLYSSFLDLPIREHEYIELYSDVLEDKNH